MTQVALVVASHGEFAKYALQSAEMIAGKQDNYEILSIDMDFDLQNAIDAMKEKLSHLDRSAGTIILVDILGGTPSNVSGRLVFEEENILVLSGLNLPMLLDLLTNRERSLDELATSLEGSYQQGFKNITELFKQGDDDDECEVL